MKFLFEKARVCCYGDRTFGAGLSKENLTKNIRILVN